MSRPIRSPIAGSETSSTAVGTARFELRRHHVIDRKLEPNAPRFRARNHRRGAWQPVVLDQRRADRKALRFEKRVGHRAADDERVHLAQQVLDDLDLVRHFRAAEDGHERSRRLLDRLARDTGAPSPSGTPPRLCRSRGRCASTDACARCAAPNASFTYRSAISASLAAKTGSFFSSSGWNRRFSSSTTWLPACAVATAFVASSPMQSEAKTTARPSSSDSRPATGFRLYSGATLPFGRPRCDARIDRRALVEGVRDGRQRRADARVVADRAVLDRHVEIDADEDLLAPQIEVADRQLHRRNLKALCRPGPCSRSTQRLE